MNYEIIPTPEFEKSLKRLHKTYRLIGKDLEKLQSELQNDANDGIELGGGCYKTRLPNSSIPTGRSGGFRVIYYKKIENKIYLLEIYSKTELNPPKNKQNNC